MITEIELKFGSSIGQPNLKIELTPLTIFVGANNSGKSKALQELLSYCSTNSNQPKVIIGNIIHQKYTKDEALEEIQQLESLYKDKENPDNEILALKKPYPEGEGVYKFRVSKQNFIDFLINGYSKFHSYEFLKLFTLNLNGSNRLHLLNQQQRGDLQESPINTLSHLFKQDKIREEIRKIIYEAVNHYFMLDPSNSSYIRVRYSKVPIENPSFERSLTDEALDFQNNAIPIENMSDGVKAYSGIIASLYSVDPKILIIDEPEAFLHPRLSAKLGKEVGKISRSSDKIVFTATHSAQFIMGCIQSEAPVNIVRLTFNGELGTARLLSNDRLKILMRDPLLRSTGVLNGLFYDVVVVVEGNSDRVFYQEINERLLDANDSRGMQNCLFVIAQGKDSIYRIISPLREMGIPTVSIVDLDFIEKGGKNFESILSAIGVPSASHNSLKNYRDDVYKLFKGNKDYKRNGGVTLLNNSDRASLIDFLDQLEKYGWFVVRSGEVESWLKHLGANTNKTGWVEDIFTRMGSDPESPNYCKPENGDVWDFIGNIKKWSDDPNRKGMPV